MTMPHPQCWGGMHLNVPHAYEENRLSNYSIPRVSALQQGWWVGWQVRPHLWHHVTWPIGRPTGLPWHAGCRWCRVWFQRVGPSQSQAGLILVCGVQSGMCEPASYHLLCLQGQKAEPHCVSGHSSEVKQYVLILHVKPNIFDNQ